MDTRSHPKQSTLKQEAANENTSPARLRELAGMSTQLARIVAKNCNADPELLRELAASSDDLTRKEVASNPNTPTEILWKLGEFPEELLNNPVFALSMLEDPNFLENIPHDTLCSLLQHHAVPDSFLEKAVDASDWEIRLAIATNSKTPKNILEKLINYRSTALNEEVRLHVNWVGEISEGWDEIAKAAMKTTNLRCNRSYKNEDSMWIVGAMHVHEACLPLLDKHVGLEIARSSSTSIYLLQLLANANANYKTLKAIIENPSITVNLLEQLLGDREYYIRQLIIYHPDISLSVLQEFYTQLKAATLLETSPQVLRKLVGVGGKPYAKL